jgi:hypothetical protein
MENQMNRVWRKKRPQASSIIFWSVRTALLLVSFILIGSKFSFLPTVPTTASEAQSSAPDVRFKGKDILIVLGSDGKHPLDVHGDEIRSNREDYAIYHGITEAIFSPSLTAGYQFMFANLSEYRLNDQHAAWTKMAFLTHAFNQYPEAEWIWWLDFDALIMNPFLDLCEYILNPEAMFSKLMKDQKFPLTHLGQDEDEVLVLPADPDPNDINLLISHDQNGLNAGSFFLRRGKWTDFFLKLWSDPVLMLEKKWWAQEQDALIHIFRHHYTFINGHVGIVPQQEFNAYVPDDINRASLSKGGITVDAGFWTPDVIAIHFAGCW